MLGLSIEESAAVIQSGKDGRALGKITGSNNGNKSVKVCRYTGLVHLGNSELLGTQQYRAGRGIWLEVRILIM